VSAERVSLLDEHGAQYAAKVAGHPKDLVGALCPTCVSIERFNVHCVFLYYEYFFFIYTLPPVLILLDFYRYYTNNQL
jgi:hypothetical protein